MKNIRALHIVGQLGFGGIPTWLRAHISQADRKELSIDICCNYRKEEGALAQEFRELGCAVFHVPLDLNLFSYQKKLRKIIKEGNYSVVHDHRGILSGGSLRAACREGVPMRIMYHHTPDDELVRGFFRNFYIAALRKWAFTYATHIWGCSKSVMIGQYGAKWREKDSRFDVLYGAVAPRKPSENARSLIRNELGIDGRVKLIGFIGRVNHQKNVIVAIKTCMEVLLRRNDARVLWIGEGPFLDQVRDIAKSSGLFNYFYFFNFRKDIPDILQAIDVLFMPSNFEGFPLLVLEALHAGVPFVGSNTPGILEALPDRLQRFCAEPDNINAHVENVFEAFQSTRGSINGDDFLGQFSPVAFHKRVAMKYTASLSK